MLAAARNTHGWGTLNLTQGGYSGVAASAGTHLKLDVVDITVKNKSKALVWEFCKNLFECGNLPFPRGYVNDSFQNLKHIHNLWWPCDQGTASLRRQYIEYLNGGDGLVGSAKYTGPRCVMTTWANSMFNPGNRIVYPSPVKVRVNARIITTLLGLDRSRNQKTERIRGFEFNAVAKIQRWGRWNYLTKHETFYAAEYCDIDGNDNGEDLESLEDRLRAHNSNGGESEQY